MIDWFASDVLGAVVETLQLFIALLVVGTGVGGWFVWKRLVLRNEQRADDGYVAADDTLGALVGSTGTVVAALRPAGKATIDGKRVDVVSDSEFIARDTPVTVVEVEGGRVVVRASAELPSQGQLGK